MNSQQQMVVLLNFHCSQLDWWQQMIKLIWMLLKHHMYSNFSSYVVQPMFRLLWQLDMNKMAESDEHFDKSLE